MENEKNINQFTRVLVSVMVAVLCVGAISRGVTRIGSNITSDGTLSVSGNATTTGSHYIGQDLNIGNNITTSGMLSVTGTSTFSGNVGIGTTMPGYNLSINGTTSPFFQIASSTNQEIMVVDAQGNVGIGTSSPMTNFVIAGSNAGKYLTFDSNKSILNIANQKATTDWEGVVARSAVTIGYLKTIDQTTNVTGVTLVVPGDDYSVDGDYALVWDSGIAFSTLAWGGGYPVTISTSTNGTYYLPDSSSNMVIAVVNASALPGTDQTDSSITISTVAATDGFDVGADLSSAYVLEEFNGYLYLGMENDATDRPELYRSIDGITWARVLDEEFFTSSADDHFDQNASAVFNGYIYMATNDKITRSKDGLLWEIVYDPSGVSNLRRFEVFKGYLYVAGINSTATAMKVFRTRDGINWEQSGDDGFGQGSGIRLANWMTQYGDYLYCATYNYTVAKGELYRTNDGVTWNLVKQFESIGGGIRYLENGGGKVFRGYLYALAVDINKEFYDLVRTKDGINWEIVNEETNLALSIDFPHFLIVFNNKLYVLCRNARIYESVDGLKFTQVSTTQFGATGYDNYWLSAHAIFKGYLYVGFSESSHSTTIGGEVWRLGSGLIKSRGSLAVDGLSAGNVSILGDSILGIEDAKIENSLKTQFLHVSGGTNITATTTGYGLLTVQQNGPGNILSLFDDSTEVFSVLDGGKVGVGTTAPSTQLEVYDASLWTGVAIHSDASNAILNLDSATDYDASINFKEAGAVKWDIKNDGDDNDKFLIRSSAANTRFVIDQTTGSVGVGTTTPAGPLDVYTTATTTMILDSNAAAKGSCLKLKDVDGGGYTYCYVLNGEMTCTSTSCE